MARPKTKESEAQKAEVKKEPKKSVKREDFQYIVRIANRDINGERQLVLALADLKGIGVRLSTAILNRLELPKTKKIGELKEDEIEKIRQFIESKEYAGFPAWTMNHRNETVSGKTYNLVSNDLDIMIQDDINLMKKIKSYKGLRHDKGKTVRGQRTRSNGRKGLSVGVIRKKEGT